MVIEVGIQPSGALVLLIVRGSGTHCDHGIALGIDDCPTCDREAQFCQKCGHYNGDVEDPHSPLVGICIFCLSFGEDNE